MYYKLNTKVIDADTKYLIDIELVIKSSNSKVTIDSSNNNKLFLFPIFILNGIRLEHLIFPLNCKVKNNNLLFCYNYLSKICDIKKTNIMFPDFFLDTITQYFNIGKNNLQYFEDDFLNSYNYLYNEKIIFEEYLTHLFLLPIKLKNLVILNKDNIKTRIINDILNIPYKIMYSGQYFDNLINLLKLIDNNNEFNYINNIKHTKGTEKFYNNNEKFLLNRLLEINYYDIIGIHLKNNNNNLELRKENIVNILLNFWNNTISNFQLILFVLGNNLEITTNDNKYKYILDISKRILNVEGFISFSDYNQQDIQLVNNFLNKYPKFKKILLVSNVKNINYMLDFKKKNLDENINKLLLLELDQNDKKLILNECNYKIKKQLLLILNDLNSCYSNEKLYNDATIRVYFKMCINNIGYEKFNKYNFFRNYFNNIKWQSIIYNFELIDIMSINSDILLYYGKPNAVIFNNVNFKNISDIIKNKFSVINYYDKQSVIYDFLLHNYKELGLILDNFINLSNIQVRNLAKIIYTSKFVKKHSFNDELYKFFINLCKKNTNVLIRNNKFNLHLKNIHNLPELNYGILTRDIIRYKIQKEIVNPYEEINKYKTKYLLYKKKYSKYKAKFFLEREKNKKGYIKKMKKLQKKSK